VKLKKITMKSVVRVLLIVMLAMGITSCEKIKNLFNVDVDTVIEGDLFIQVDETPQLKSTVAWGFDESVTVEILNEDLYEYEDVIENFKVNGMTIEITSVSSDTLKFLAGTEFSMSNANHTVSWELTEDWPIQVGTSIDLVDAGIYDQVEAILIEMVPFTLRAVGSCNEGGAAIGIRLNINTTVTANPT
jgi:hypothetical protein